MPYLAVSHNKEKGKIDEFTENLNWDVAKFDYVLTKLDETMQWIADGENVKEKFRDDEKEEEKFWRRLY